MIEAFAYLAACSLRHYEEPTAERSCVWCHGPLTGRKQNWCSKACVDAYLPNHSWTDARRAAIARVTVTVKDWLRWSICDECGRSTSRLEVNHVDPRLGAGYQSGCWNHQTNLQVLCHECHVAETNRQRGERVSVPGPTLWAAA